MENSTNNGIMKVIFKKRNKKINNNKRNRENNENEENDEVNVEKIENKRQKVFYFMIFRLIHLKLNQNIIQIIQLMSIYIFLIIVKKVNLLIQIKKNQID